MDDLERYWWSFRDAVGFAVGTPGRALGVGILSVLSYVLMILSSFPAYSYQILGDSLFNIGEAVSVLTADAYISLGPFWFVLLPVYSILTGVAIVNLVVLVREKGLTSLLNAGSITPAFLIGGCASCGAGLLGFLGFVGAVGALPLAGNELRIFGIVLLAYFLASTGNPRTCQI
jgi:hypothetical protein